MRPDSAAGLMIRGFEAERKALSRIRGASNGEAFVDFDTQAFFSIASLRSSLRHSGTRLAFVDFDTFFFLGKSRFWPSEGLGNLDDDSDLRLGRQASG